MKYIFFLFIIVVVSCTSLEKSIYREEINEVKTLRKKWIGKSVEEMQVAYANDKLAIQDSIEFKIYSYTIEKGILTSMPTENGNVVTSSRDKIDKTIFVTKKDSIINVNYKIVKKF